MRRLSPQFRLRAALWLLLALCLAATPAAGGSLPAGFAELADGGSATVTEIVDGDTVILGDGRQVRLVGIQAPKLPLGRPGFVAWPLADEAKSALAELVANRQVRLGYGGARRDRYKRELAHLFVDDENGNSIWVQADLLRAGMARVYTFADNRALAARMYVLEDDARKAGHGIWAHPFYAVLDPASAAVQTGDFALVTGRVLRTDTVRGRIYLNFGEDYRTDFTISVSGRDWRRFDTLGISPQDYAGRRIRVRGWLQSRNGPMIEATHPEQIELLTP